MFDAPYSFVKNSEVLSGKEISYSTKYTNQEVEDKIAKKHGKGDARQEALGLLNKPLFKEDSAQVVEEEKQGDPQKFNPAVYLSNMNEEEVKLGDFN